MKITLVIEIVQIAPGQLALASRTNAGGLPPETKLSPEMSLLLRSLLCGLRAAVEGFTEEVGGKTITLDTSRFD